MTITKIGHCCLLIQTKGLTILTDPGSFSTGQNDIKDVNYILITHEHADHLHVDSLKKVLINNPGAKIITNIAVGKLLEKEGITYEILDGKNDTKLGAALSGVEQVHLEACDGKHEEIFEEIGQVQNTGYFIDDRLFYPGDSFSNPGKPVEILALPVAGPWCRVEASIRYAISLSPKYAFPVHDGQLMNDRIGGYHGIPQKVLNEKGIQFASLKKGETREFVV